MRFAGPLFLLMIVVGSVNGALAAGNGAGAGGAGAQRAINSGLPPGEPGPLGSVNNPHRAVTPQPPNPIEGSVRPDTATRQGQ